jgi:hypothetical protein
MKKKAVISLFLLFAVFTSLAPAIRADSSDDIDEPDPNQLTLFNL